MRGLIGEPKIHGQNRSASFVCIHDCGLYLEYGIRNAHHIASIARQFNNESEDETMTETFDVIRSNNSLSVPTFPFHGKRDTKSCNISTDFISPVPLPLRRFVFPIRLNLGPLGTKFTFSRTASRCRTFRKSPAQVQSFVFLYCRSNIPAGCSQVTTGKFPLLCVSDCN